MQRKARLGVLAVLPVAAAVTLVVLVSGGPAASDGTKQQASFGPGAVVSSAPLAVTKAAQGRILAYWTEERMRNAKPVPAPRVMGKPKSGLTALGPSGPPRTIPGSAPVSSEPPLLDASGGSQTLGYTYPFPYTRHGVDGSVKRPVYRAIGKMFFTQGTTDFVCSGASVVSSPNNAVYTAGHCV